MIAPRRRSGAATRAIGLREREASPTRTLRNGCAASTPERIRIVVPELPQSIGTVGAVRPWSPTPWTRSVPAPSSSTRTPIARIASRVETLSPPYENPRISLVPVASDASKSARCAMLLSLGTGTLPRRGALCGRTRKSTRDTFSARPAGPERRAGSSKRAARGAPRARVRRARGGTADRDRSPECPSA